MSNKKLNMMAFACFIFLYVGCTNKNNTDNAIYTVGKIFTFNATGIDNLKKIDLEITDGYYPDQTKILWHHYYINGNETTIASEWTGLIDDNEHFFIHQPRSEKFNILKFAEFPSIDINLQDDFVGHFKSSGTVSMMKKYNDVLITKVKTSKKYIGKENITLPNIGERNVHKCYHSAKSEIGTIDGHFFFDAELGFVKMTYNLPDNNKIELELSKLPYHK